MIEFVLMGKKRLVIDLDESEHEALVKKARKASLTVSNYVRGAINLPMLRQGVKRAPAKQKAVAPKSRKGA